MADLAEFLLARIAEDEAVAREAHVTTALPPIWDTGLFYGPSAPASEHIARWDPARVLAECEAKQRIVAWHRMINGLDTEDRPVRGCGNCIASGAVAPYIIAGPCMTVRLLALPYADHPDCRDEWKP